MKHKYIVAAVAAVVVGGSSFAQMGQPVPTAPPPGQAPPMRGVNERPLVLTDQQFVQQASSANNFEIELSKLADQKLDDPQIKQMAKEMLKDHQDAQEKLVAIAEKNDIKYSSGITDPRQKQMLSQIQDKTGEEFQTVFLKDEQQAHLQAIALFTRAQTQIKNQDLKDYAQSNLPKLQQHMAMLREHQQGAQPAGAAMPGQDKANQPYSPDQQKRPDQNQQQSPPAQDQPAQRPMPPTEPPDRPEH